MRVGAFEGLLDPLPGPPRLVGGEVGDVETLDVLIEEGGGTRGRVRSNVA